jgi:hypothetical protein
VLRWRGLPLQLLAVTILPLTALLLIIAFGSLFLHQRAMRQLVSELRVLLRPPSLNN